MQILTTQPSCPWPVAYGHVISVQCCHQRHPELFGKLHRCVAIRSEVGIDQARSARPQPRNLRPRRAGIAKAKLAQSSPQAAAIDRPAGVFGQVDPAVLRQPTKNGENRRMAAAWATINVSEGASSWMRKITMVALVPWLMAAGHLVITCPALSTSR
jgi:hypothetical protein